MIYRSPYPDVPVPAVSLPELVLERARERGSHRALIDGTSGSVTTYAELADAVEGLAAGLHGLGLRRREVAAICAPSCVEFPVVLLAVTRLGAAVTTMNPAFTPEEMARQLADAGAVVAFTTPELADRVREAGGGRLRNVLCFGDDAFVALTRTPGAAPRVDIDPAEDVAVLPYSSGTTGAPKGVMLTHRNLVAMLLAMHPVEATTERDVTIAVLPFFHIYGLAVILSLGLYRGATLVVFPRFQMEQFLAAVERWRVTRLPLVPPLVLRLARDPMVGRFDLSSVRVAVSGAAPLPPHLARELSERLHCLVKQGYGMTELSPGSHMHAEDAGTPPPGSVGVLHANTECRLVDPATLRDVAAGERGEIWVRGPQVMKGYLNRPEATAEIITPDGWLRTGDVGTIDADGQLYVVDRLKELVKYKGYQVAPAELESVLLSHPAVADVAVVPKPDVEAGEIPKAFVVVQADADATPEELMAFVAERVAPYKRVREVEFVAEVPKSPSGKILRRVLVERERARAISRLPGQ
jgi:acyl-CoA synthetase (AMP-forming)/AMP-acid ligase II